MITSRTTPTTNLFVLSAALVVAVLATVALLAFTQLGRQATARTREPIAVANPFPYYRLQELSSYKQSEWGLDGSQARAEAPWFDMNRLPADYVRSEKGAEGTRVRPRDLFTDLMTVK